MLKTRAVISNLSSTSSRSLSTNASRTTSIAIRTEKQLSSLRIVPDDNESLSSKIFDAQQKCSDAYAVNCTKVQHTDELCSKLARLEESLDAVEVNAEDNSDLEFFIISGTEIFTRFRLFKYHQRCSKHAK